MPRGSWCRGALAGVLAVVFTTGSGRAQAPDLLVSLSTDNALPTQVVRDQDLVFHQPGTTAYVAWPSETLSMLAGDSDGANALHLVFGDIDALHDAGPGADAADALYLSIPVNQGSLQDGDVLHSSSGGFSVFLAEADFVVATGAADGNVDIDAFHLEDDGRVLFSFADNEDSVFLSGDDPNVVRDGAILAWDPLLPEATLVFTENQVQALVVQALGTAVTINDTTGLARDPATGELLFSVLSPSAHDASVFTLAGGGTLLAGHAELDFGFTGAAELDALSVARARFPALTTSDGRPPAGATVSFGLQGAQFGIPYILLGAMDTAPFGFGTYGWGQFVLPGDALLVLMWSEAAAFVMTPDVAGVAGLLTSVPPVVQPIDVYVQAIAPSIGPESSNPLVLELAQ